MKMIQRTLFAALLLVASLAQAQGIAFITNLKGDVTLDGNARPMLLAELAKGQRLVVGKDSSASVMYTASGKEYVLNGPGDYVVRDTEVSSGSGMPPVARSTEWRASNKVLVQVAQTAGASVRMRSVGRPKADTMPMLLFPTEGNVATLQPVFRWRAADAKAQGDFALMVVGQAKPVHESKAAGSYRVPAKLKPETEYRWMVTVNGQEIGTGGFRTLPASAIHDIEKRKPADKAEFSDRLLYALYLQEMGAAQEAREAWAKLSQERADLPELSALAK